MFNWTNMWTDVKSAIKQEFIYRYLILGVLLVLFPTVIAVIISALIYGLRNIVFFKYPVVIIEIVVGTALGFLFLVLPHPFGYIICVIAHTPIIYFAQRTEIMEQWVK